MSGATVSEKGWIVIPKEIRDRYGLSKGKRVHVVDIEGTIYLIPALEDPIRDARGMFAEGASLTQGLLEDRQAEAEREEGKLATKSVGGKSKTD